MSKKTEKVEAKDNVLYCPVCRSARYGKFCFTCGGPLIEAMFPCNHCKEQTSVLCRFCTECGKPVHEQVATHIAKCMQGIKEDKNDKGTSGSDDLDDIRGGVAGPEGAR